MYYSSIWSAVDWIWGYGGPTINYMQIFCCTGGQGFQIYYMKYITHGRMGHI